MAGELGLDPASVVVREADTDAAGLDVGVGGGRTTVSIGAASVSACVEVREKLLKTAAEMLQTRPEDLVTARAASRSGAAGLRHFDRGRGAARALDQRPDQRLGRVHRGGERRPCRLRHGPFHRRARYSRLVVHEAEVAVDPDTGHVEVLAYRVVQDVGRALNPRAILGQIQGGVVQGLGYALHEEVTITKDGRIAQDGFETYRVPLGGDAVPVAVDLFEGAPSIGPLGTKGAGEVPILGVGAAIACAVARAIGKPVQRLPLTPPRVLALLHDREPMPQLDHIAADILGQYPRLTSHHGKSLPDMVTLNCDMGESYGKLALRRRRGDHAPDRLRQHRLRLPRVRPDDHAADGSPRALARQARRRPSVPARPRGLRPARDEAPARGVTAAFLYQIRSPHRHPGRRGGTLSHVQPHGIIYGMAARDLETATRHRTRRPTLRRAALRLAGTAHETAAAELGVAFQGEFFPDLAYGPDGGLLIPRVQSEIDLSLVERRMRRALDEGQLETSDGTLRPVRFDTVCMHSDPPNAAPWPPSCGR